MPGKSAAGAAHSKVLRAPTCGMERFSARRVITTVLTMPEWECFNISEMALTPWPNFEIKNQVFEQEEPEATEVQSKFSLAAIHDVRATVAMGSLIDKSG